MSISHCQYDIKCVVQCVCIIYVCSACDGEHPVLSTLRANVLFIAQIHRFSHCQTQRSEEDEKKMQFYSNRQDPHSTHYGIRVSGKILIICTRYLCIERCLAVSSQQQQKCFFFYSIRFGKRSNGTGGCDTFIYYVFAHYFHFYSFHFFFFLLSS